MDLFDKTKWDKDSWLMHFRKAKDADTLYIMAERAREKHSNGYTVGAITLAEEQREIELENSFPTVF